MSPGRLSDEFRSAVRHCPMPLSDARRQQSMVFYTIVPAAGRMVENFALRPCNNVRKLGATEGSNAGCLVINRGKRRRTMAETNDQDFYNKVFPVPERVREKSYIKSRAEYEEMYKRSIENPDAFWAEQALKRLSWFKPFDKNKVSDWSRQAQCQLQLPGPPPGDQENQGRHHLRGQ